MNSYNNSKMSPFERSDSGSSPEKNTFKITSNSPIAKHPLPYKNKYNLSSESEISSLSQDSEDQEERIKLELNKKTIQVGNSEEQQSEQSQDSGVDIIEQRIKRLQIDLSDKIDKQKKLHEITTKQKKLHQINTKQLYQSQDTKYKDQAAIIKTYSFSNPPLPPTQISQKKQHLGIFQKVVHRPAHEQSENINRLNIIKKVEKNGSKEKGQTHQIEEDEVKPKEKPFSISPKIKQPKKGASDRHEKQRIGSKSSSTAHEGNAVSLLNKAHRQIDDLQKIMEELKEENHHLRQDLVIVKKKPVSEQLQSLKAIGSRNYQKLQKQIQTLKALESLQAKLKKSIDQKLKGNRINSTQPIFSQNT